MNPTKNLIEAKLYMNPTKNLIEGLGSMRFLVGVHLKFRFYQILVGLM
jgi:hypothetical protein